MKLPVRRTGEGPAGSCSSLAAWVGRAGSRGPEVQAGSGLCSLTQLGRCRAVQSLHVSSASSYPSISHRHMWVPGTRVGVCGGHLATQNSEPMFCTVFLLSQIGLSLSAAYGSLCPLTAGLHPFLQAEKWARGPCGRTSECNDFPFNKCQSAVRGLLLCGGRSTLVGTGHSVCPFLCDWLTLGAISL